MSDSVDYNVKLLDIALTIALKHDNSTLKDFASSVEQTVYLTNTFIKVHKAISSGQILKAEDLKNI